MTQRVETRVREPEQPSGVYEEIYNRFKQKREQAAMGAVVVRNKDVEWEVARQGRLKYLCHPSKWEKQAAPGWSIFIHDIRRHSGKHVHQGGLSIFVLEGKGYTVVDGVRYDWQAGDLILLPIKPGGCEHQHFNLVEGESCKWVAFVYSPLKDSLGYEFNQRELSPEYKP